MVCILVRKELLEQAWDCHPFKGLLLWGCPLAGFWELQFPNKNGSLCLNYLCKQYGLCLTHAFLLSPEVSVSSREYQGDHLLTKTLSIECLVSFPGRHFTFVVNLIAIFGRRFRFAPGFLSTMLHVPFPFVDSTLYPCTLISHSHKKNHLLSHPNKLLSLGMVLGISDKCVYRHIHIHVST